MKRITALLFFIFMSFGLVQGQNNTPQHGWHSYCGSDFNNAIGGPVPFIAAISYPADMMADYAGTSITKVAIFSDTLYNAVGGRYICSVYVGGQPNLGGQLVVSDTLDVAQSLNDWAEFDLSTPVMVTGDDEIWIVWNCIQQLTSFPMGVCEGNDPSGNGNWLWNMALDLFEPSMYGDWTLKTYFHWDGPQPQPLDVYVAGNHFTTGKVLKNNTLLYSLTDSLDIQLRGIQVAEDGTVYGAGSAFNTDGFYGRVWMNDSCVFVSDSGTYFDHIALNGNDWIVAGFNNIWQNGELLYSYNHEEDECHIHDLAVDTTTGDIYAGGAISFNSDSLYHASIWKNDLLLWMADSTSSIQSICFDGDNLYAAGFMVENDSLTYGVIWQNDSIIYQLENTNFGCIAAFGSSLYWSGIVPLSDTVVRIWQDGEELYALPELSGISNLVVTESGVYYTDAQTVYKDDDVLYQPEECIISDLIVKPAPPQPEYTLTVEVDSIGGGTVTGGGIYHYGDTATIEAIPDMGCEFLFWNDGIVTNPRDIVITQDTTFVAHFNRFNYSIETAVIPLNSGTVTGGGNYPYGDTITLEAVANPGFIFERWTDSVTDNPRDIVVTQDSTFVAMFSPRQYTITVESNNPEWGYVTGGGTFYYGDTIQIEAFANHGYEFSFWTGSGNGSYDNPLEVIVTEDQTYIAHFGLQQCVIQTGVIPAGAGTVTGAGPWGYLFGDTITLTAQSNFGYVFSHWDDGVTDNPRTIVVEGDATYIAVFTPLQFEITTECDPEEGGTVSGAGFYDYNSTATLTATANVNYIFLCWSDGIASNPRSVTVTGNANYKALFHLNGTPQYTITVVANDPSLGNVTGSGTYPEGTSIEISATPNDNAIFKGWDDENTDNPRTIIVTEDMTFTALFAATTPPETYTITVRPEFPLLGSTYGSGTYPVNEFVTIGATPNDGFYFSGWQDGNTENPRTIIVMGDAEYIASFSQNPVETYTVTVLYDETHGFILGAGSYLAGSLASIAAIPADGFAFKRWGDGTTDNPKEVLVDHDITLAAFFENTGVDETGFGTINLYPNPANDRIHIEGLEGEHEVQIYNAFGMLVMTTTLLGDSEINISDLPTGYYLIRIDNRRTVKFIKENK